jgi:ribosome maturation factor RimP
VPGFRKHARRNGGLIRHNPWISALFLIHFAPRFWGNESGLAKPTFCLWGGFAMDLNGLLESTLTGMGYELVGVERPSRGGLLRIYIDKPGGITVDDCAAVSHHLSRLLTVENVRYDRLEVSSPGLDRLLKGERDFARFAGQKARVRMRAPVDGQRNFTGVVREAAAGRLQLEVDGRLLSLEIGNVETARLVPEL